MTISVQCGCGKRFDVPDSYRGRTGQCTACGAPLAVPEADLQASGEQLAAFAGGPAPAAPPAPAPLPAPLPPPVSLQTPQPAQPAPPAQTRVSIGRELGAYTIQTKLGGERSTVFLAEGPQGKVALKVLPNAIVAKNPTAGKRFLRETRELFGLVHPRLVRVHDAGEELGTYFLVMEHVEGTDLEAVRQARGGKLPEAEVLTIGLGVAQGLEALAARSLVHRNLKPEHLLRGPGGVKVAGMGLLRQSEREDSAAAVTVKGAVVGTPQYMSPEQARAGDLDTRSDLYSLGITLYVLLTGEIPFQDKVTTRILRKLMNEKPAPVRELAPEVSEGLEALVHKLVEKKPELRYQSAQELIGDLEAIRSGKLIGGLPPVVAADQGSAAPTKASTSTALAAAAGESQSTVKLMAAVIVVLLVVIAGLVAAVLGAK